LRYCRNNIIIRRKLKVQLSGKTMSILSTISYWILKGKKARDENNEWISFKLTLAVKVLESLIRSASAYLINI